MAEQDSSMKFSNKNLDDIIKALRKKIILRIGIMGSDAQTEHEGSGLTNAQLGTIHEQPDNDGKKIPKRSFLLEPLQEKLNLTTDENKYLRKELFKRYFDDKAPEKFYKALGTKALQIVDQAFMTNGYNQWTSLSQAYLKRKINSVKSKKKREEYAKNNKILVRSGALRRSISMKIIKPQ
ncbi:MAG TPA: hypothetical protein IAD11_01940 [Candidatus Stercorousia faecigallinarum]|nr:hypothetical protein [Candidatus Stercorousia faecigallinarum]